MAEERRGGISWARLEDESKLRPRYLPGRSGSATAQLSANKSRVISPSAGGGGGGNSKLCKNPRDQKNKPETVAPFIIGSGSSYRRARKMEKQSAERWGALEERDD